MSKEYTGHRKEPFVAALNYDHMSREPIGGVGVELAMRGLAMPSELTQCPFHFLSFHFPSRFSVSFSLLQLFALEPKKSSFSFLYRNWCLECSLLPVRNLPGEWEHRFRLSSFESSNPKFSFLVVFSLMRFL